MKLTSKQIKVLEGFAKGKTAKEIGIELKCSHRAIEGLSDRVKISIGATNIAHAVYIGLKNNLIK